MNDKWMQRYLNLAEHIAGWSKDPSTKVGAVIVSNSNHIVSLGYNGLPRGVMDFPYRYTDRDTKYKMILHAERNAIIFAEKSLLNCTIYTWPMPPCAACASMIVQTGIKNVVAPEQIPERWHDDFLLSREIYTESGIKLWLL